MDYLEGTNYVFENDSAIRKMLRIRENNSVKNKNMTENGNVLQLQPCFHEHVYLTLVLKIITVFFKKTGGWGWGGTECKQWRRLQWRAGWHVGWGEG